MGTDVPPMFGGACAIIPVLAIAGNAVGVLVAVTGIRNAFGERGHFLVERHLRLPVNVIVHVAIALAFLHPFSENTSAQQTLLTVVFYFFLFSGLLELHWLLLMARLYKFPDEDAALVACPRFLWIFGVIQAAALLIPILIAQGKPIECPQFVLGVGIVVFLYIIVWIGISLLVVYLQNELAFCPRAQKIQVPVVHRMRCVQPLVGASAVASMVYILGWRHNVCAMLTTPVGNMNIHLRLVYLLLTLFFFVVPTALGSYTFGPPLAQMTLKRHTSLNAPLLGSVPVPPSDL
eukprot:TRINITY_DN4208_c0_g1_i1.p1 TRINITY_DN4208_c0_g1~~TRINITY_DN4208_c0_g1_i1.p1  ORF type:complete len:291 (+),score=41.67 TRINITY_DN4208_c0_g1_i1:60-932(+)